MATLNQGFKNGLNFPGLPELKTGPKNKGDWERNPVAVCNNLKKTNRGNILA
jgi:hypothetical protein